VDAIGAGLDLLRIAVGEDLAEAPRETWIEHRDFALRARTPMPSRFEEALDFLPGDGLARGRGETDFEGEPVLPARTDAHRRGDRFDLPEGVLETLARPRLPAPLEGGIAVGEELQDRLLVFEDEASAFPSLRKTRSLEFGDGGLFGGGVGEDEAVPLLPYGGPVRGGGNLTRPVYEDEIGVEVVERTFDRQTHRRRRARHREPLCVEVEAPRGQQAGKGGGIGARALRQQL